MTSKRNNNEKLIYLCFFIGDNINRFESIKKSPVMEPSKAEDDNRLRTKSKTDEGNFTSLPAELALKKQSPERDNMSDDDENKPAPKTIQERMAALKRQQTNNEWKKPSSVSNTSQEGSSPTKNAFKQNQMQLRQQLLMATPNSATPYQLLKEKNREMGSLDNNDDAKEDYKLSNESLDNDTEESLPAVAKPKATKPKSMFNAELEKALSFKAPGQKQRQLSSNNRSETSEKPEMFSTDSEMDSFFKDKNKYDDLFSSSCGSPSRTDENLIDELDDDFDKIKSSQM